jgi:hypothetical protein
LAIEKYIPILPNITKSIDNNEREVLISDIHKNKELSSLIIPFLSRKNKQAKVITIFSITTNGFIGFSPIVYIWKYGKIPVENITSKMLLENTEATNDPNSII